MTSPTPPSNAARGNALLLGVAAVLAGLAAVELLRPIDPAQAAVVSRAGGLTVLTADAGNEDVVVMLDERSEGLLVYRTDGRLGVQLMQKIPIGQLFTEARARSLGKP
jgi:hypothetical protein